MYIVPKWLFFGSFEVHIISFLKSMVLVHDLSSSMLILKPRVNINLCSVMTAKFFWAVSEARTGWRIFFFFYF